MKGVVSRCFLALVILVVVAGAAWVGPLRAGELVGTYGTFKWTITGTKIDIQFDPKPGETVCQDIRLKQVYRQKINGVVQTPSSVTSSWDYRDDDHLPTCWTIDHVRCEKDGNYNGNDPQDVGSGGSVGATTATPSTMSDRPSSSYNNMEYEFEICAYCVDNGAWLGCITWKYAKDAAGNATVTVTATAVTDPSTNMLDADEEFNDNHTDGNGDPYCPELAADRAAGDGTKETERGVPTFIRLLGFNAVEDAEGVLVDWSFLVIDLNNAGFNLYRSIDTNDDYRLVNTGGLIVGENHVSYIDRDVEIGHTYRYKLGSVDLHGNVVFHGPVSVNVIGRVSDRQLLWCYPNPANGTATIAYRVMDASQMDISIYDSGGRLVRTLASEKKKPGLHRIVWDGADANGRKVSPGTYYCRFRVGSRAFSKKLTIVR